jgi:pimeloyl-ACP methyl ester carboxylesterase
LVDRVARGGKVDVITHSAGSIVALTYVKLGGDAQRVEHLVMLAPTQRGVIDAFRVLVRPEVFLRRVFRPDIVATWPFVTELLPESGRFLMGDDRDLWRPESWRELLALDDAHRRAFEQSLLEARAFRDELRNAPMASSVHVSVLAGDCVPTARRAMRRADGSYVFYVSELREDEKPLAKTLFLLRE